MAGAQPPRAVLGFATGEEVVVTPNAFARTSAGGDEHWASQVQLAKIVPMGDHAAIQSMSLQSHSE